MPEKIIRKRKPRDPTKLKTSPYKGVSKNSIDSKYVAQYKIQDVTTYLGSFESEVEAAVKYDTALYAQMLAGNTAMKISRLNFGIPTLPETEEKIDTAFMIDLLAEELMPISKKMPKHVSSYRGVSWYEQRKSWKASIQIDKKNTFLGRYKTEETAARAYNQKLSALAAKEQDPIKRKKLLGKLYSVPDTETFYPKHYAPATLVQNIAFELPGVLDSVELRFASSPSPLLFIKRSPSPSLTDPYTDSDEIGDSYKKLRCR